MTRTTQMDHVALARIGFKELERQPQQAGADVVRLKRWLEKTSDAPQAVAGQEAAQVAGCCGPTQVNQCHRCHLTTAWNDIKGVGFYKHH